MANFYYPITTPLKQFFDTNGLPLNGGYLFFGVANQNPETTPTQMYWDAAGMIPAAQPIRTLNGFPVRGGQGGVGGTPANIYAPGDFSMTVRNSQLALVTTSPVSVDIQLATSVVGSSLAATIALADAGNYYTTDNVEAAFQQLGPLFAEMTTALAALVPTGTVTDWVGTDVGPHAVPAPTGWLYLSGKTIGNATSGATAVGGASDANEALFTLLWNSYAQTELPIQDSGGGASTRGASASNDFGNSKRLPLPDCRGRVRAGRGDMGTVDAARLTAAGLGAAQSGITMGAASTGATGFTQTHALTTGELASHTHVASVTDPTHTHVFTAAAHSHTVPVAAGSTPSGAAATGVTTGGATTTSSVTVTGTNAAIATGVTVANATAGSNTAFSVVQPTIIFSAIIKI